MKMQPNNLFRKVINVVFSPWEMQIVYFWVVFFSHFDDSINSFEVNTASLLSEIESGRSFLHLQSGVEKYSSLNNMDEWKIWEYLEFSE